MIRLKTLLEQTTAQSITANHNQIDNLQVTKSEDGVRGMIKKGICTYTDESGNNVTLNLTAVPGATGLSLSGNINIDANSTLFTYLKDYTITLTKTPDNSGLVNDGARLEKLIDNNNNKLVQFVNPAAEDETILFIRNKTGNVEMLYLNVIERSKK